MKEADTGIYMENETLGNFARNTASSLEPEGTVPGRAAARWTLGLLRSLRRSLESLPEGRRAGAGEWFSDNWYIAEREGKYAAADLARIGRLPASGRRPCVLEAASALVSSGRGRVTGERIRLFLDEYQHVRVFTQRELAVFVPCLKAALCRMLCGLFPERGDSGEGARAEVAENVFTSLRLLSGLDLSDTLEAVDRVEAALREDPAGVYPLMDEETRRDYRRTLAVQARRAGMDEYEAAKLVLRLASEGEDRHVGTYIYTRPLGRPRHAPTGSVYIGAVVTVSLFLTVLTGVLTASLPAALLAALPISEIVKTAADYAALRLVRPKRLPRLALEEGVPPAGRTVAVISALLTSPADGERYAGLLERYRLVSRDAGENLLFGILADLPESPTPQTPADGEILDSARAAVDGLNRRYGGGFLLLARERSRCESDNVWMGRERKRGAIEDLVLLLTGEPSPVKVLSGDAGELRGVNFILTLDGDTRLTAGTARELIGAALHPLNIPVLDEKRRRVVSGYGILEPRVAVDLAAAGRSDFTRIFAGEGGLDPYGSAVSDLYQDMWGEGTFMGKGLINVPVYRRVLSGAFPDNTVLSHDILEGAYMRCAFVSDLELADGWPYKVTSFLSRQERWVRGDWQNLRWCTRLVRTRDGTLTENTLPATDRWKLFDNLRRSLLPAATALALLLGLVTKSPALGAAALIALIGRLLPPVLASAGLLLRRGGARYHSAVISGARGACLRCLVGLLLLPAEGWVQLRAAATALFRMAVSRRNMLAWVTSSEAERRRGNTLAVNYRALAACPAFGLLTLALSPWPLAAIPAAGWLLAPALAWRLSRERRRERRMSQSDRTWLLARAGEMWRYFADNMTENENCLPPDNVQTEPSLGPAHRTSPTNIGLALLSCAAAADLGLISEREAADRARRTLGTVERLEKWRGNLLNWYDTRSLLPLEPRYVSTVDSGNFVGALIAAGAWFRELGDTETAEKCREIADGTDLAALYDPKRRLFRIGLDLTAQTPAEGWYDLFASEARQTSFIAVATGQVPRKHWRRLGRALVSRDGYSGMASWTGTMFEYLMPNLLLPCPEDSAVYESSRFCLYCQKKANPGLPWGISESAYYAFDPGLSYRYKAHGVQRLALKRGMDRERVISPYSSFLALGLDPAGAVRNLRRLERMGMSGRWGLCEALDLTPGRAGEAGAVPVRTYMAHHIGMSLVAAANALCADVFPRRFMSDPRMGAYRELLEERVPAGAPRLRQPPREVPEKPRRQESRGGARRFEGVDAVSPACLPLSNGQYSVLLAETGASRSLFRGLDVTRFEPRPLGAPGMSLALTTPEGRLNITAAPEFDRDTAYRAAFSDLSGRLEARRGDWSAALTVTVPPDLSGEVRRVEVTGPFGISKAELTVTFEPVLERYGDFAAHPAFGKLSLEASLASGVLTLRRRARPGERDVYLSVAAGVPFSAVTHSPRGGEGRGELLPYSPRMRVTLTLPLTLTGGRGGVTMALAAGFDREDTRQGAVRALGRSAAQTVSRLAAARLMLGLTDARADWALSLIPGLVYPSRPSRARLEAAGRHRREELWEAGISGDDPLLCARVDPSGALDAALELIACHAYLAENGVRADLALLLTDGGDYRSAQKTACLDKLRALGREGTLGARGGVHLVDSAHPAARAVEALSDLTVRLDAVPAVPAHRERLPQISPRVPRAGGDVKYCLEPGGTFRLALRSSLPPAAWSHVLANPAFGFIATECGTGHMWAGNSRLRPVNRWLNDPETVTGTERLYLVRGERRTSLFADGGPERTAVEYGFGWAAWERDFGPVQSRLTAFVPPEGAFRILTLELTGDTRDVEVEYSTDLTLAESDAAARSLTASFDGAAFTARNPSGAWEGELTLLPSAAPSAWTCDGTDLLMGELSGRPGAGRSAVFACRFPGSGSLALAVGTAGRAELAAALRDAGGLLRRTREHWEALTGGVHITTPDRRIDAYMNGWAVYQTAACRLTARASLYQNGGAVGFRDQLQDACALILLRPETARGQIVLAASRQYREGDVQHWWHDLPGGPFGVRTRCSDDLLWLPWALADYLRRTGDRSVLDVQAPWLISEPLRDGERDRCETPGLSQDTACVLDHAVAAAETFLARGTGGRGLALMLGGDWNDGMDSVGREGRGESVWLTLFGSLTLRALGEICEREGRGPLSEKYVRAADRLLRAAENAWTGRWYARGSYDSGELLGAPGAGECEIDSVAQSFAQFAGADRARVRTALTSALERLFDPETRLVRLFDPPFDSGPAAPGYVKSYAPGFRENGGQYTHAAVWLAMALLESGRTGEGAAVLSALSPWGRGGGYAAEPYVIAADVTSAPGLAGRAGWTWYTGSAGWYFRAVTESLLGLNLRDGRLYASPRLPASLLPVTLRLRTGGRDMELGFYPEGVLLDGRPFPEEGVKLEFEHIIPQIPEKVK